MDENWILFEAGALSKTKDAHVCTFLLDLIPSDIKQPLAMFQHTEFEMEDVRKLTHTINQTVEKSDERSLDVKRLDTIFDRFWPDLEKQLKIIADKTTKVSKPIRTDREILEEILEILRKREMPKVKVPPQPITPEMELSVLAFELDDIDRELSRLVKNGRLDAGDAGVVMLKDDIANLSYVMETLMGREKITPFKELLDISDMYKKIKNEFRQLKG